MHNLFLGTAKHVFKLWTKKKLLTKKDLKVLEERIHSFDVGTGVGRLPHRIASNYGSYTASQWKNWTHLFSVLSGGFASSKPFEMLANICPCLPVFIFSSFIED